MRRKKMNGKIIGERKQEGRQLRKVEEEIRGKQGLKKRRKKKG